MSRSYKKFPVVRQEKEDNKYSNRKLRRDKFAEISTGGAFKRHSQYTHNGKFWGEKDAINTYYNRKYFQREFETLEKFLIWYRVHYWYK